MLDLSLMERLVGALKPQARLIVLGDADQLPSVAAGAVFRDLVSAAAQVGAQPARYPAICHAPYPQLSDGYQRPGRARRIFFRAGDQLRPRCRPIQPAAVSPGASGLTSCDLRESNFSPAPVPSSHSWIDGTRTRINTAGIDKLSRQVFERRPNTVSMTAAQADFGAPFSIISPLRASCASPGCSPPAPNESTPGSIGAGLTALGSHPSGIFCRESRLSWRATITSGCCSTATRE